jgi:hypothetical protein
MYDGYDNIKDIRRQGNYYPSSERKYAQVTVSVISPLERSVAFQSWRI